MAIDMSARAHGFVFPQGMPPCAQCGREANDQTHVNPARGGVNLLMSSNSGIRQISRQDLQPRRSHAYATGYTSFAQVPCQACGQPMGASCHSAGMPAGAGVAPQVAAAQGPVQDNRDAGTGASSANEGYGQIVLTRHPFKALAGTNSVDGDYKLCAKCGFSADDEVHQNVDDDADKNLVSVKRLANPSEGFGTQKSLQQDAPPAFVTQIGGKLLLTAPASVFTQPGEDLPREIAAEWERASAQNPHFMWIDGRFVEADRANRNKAAWSSADLEMGEPTVAHGPLNWLHEERHIIGTIAAAKLVTTRQAAGTLGEELPNNHIRALAAVWNYLWPTEGRQIARASEDNKLWYSMECVSREVACLEPACTHTQSYRDYMLTPHTRCPHVKAGGNRQFVDPNFLGGAVIIPPVRPGWGGANASVMRQAAMMAERQEASFDGLTTSEAELMVAQIITYATTGGTS